MSDLLAYLMWLIGGYPPPEPVNPNQEPVVLYGGGIPTQPPTEQPQVPR